VKICTTFEVKGSNKEEDLERGKDIKLKPCDAMDHRRWKAKSKGYLCDSN